jgi:DNA (cytosine-5)-methyltransferase 1
LENVKGLVTQHRATLDNILQQLRRIGDGSYVVGYKVIDTADHGLPQHRERVYIVGLLRASLVPTARFKWPQPRKRKGIAEALRWGRPNIAKAIQKERAYLATASPRIKRNLKEVYKRIRKTGVNPRDIHCPVVIDIDSSKMHWMHNISPCLTRARASTGHYLPALGRRMTIHERLRLQGLPVRIHACCGKRVSDRQLGAMIGNSLSLNVIKALLSRILPACGLMRLPG